ncbi:MAG: tetratricopeptide repeat protein [Planctomycetes bacterium]|nr:tetratricopeptide repeat protein [Planctomycetota bacterium]
MHVGGDASYDGRFKQDPRFLALLAAAPAARARAIAVVNRRLALGYADDGEILLRFRDALDLSQRRLRLVPGDPFVTAEETGPAGPRVHITAGVEALVSGAADLQVELVHELTHAIFLVRMGGAFARLPAWLREGIALWAAGQGPARVRYYLAKREFFDEPALLVNGLDGPHGLRDYPEDFLAFDYLESRGGEQAVQRLAASLAARRPWEEALLEAAGEEWPNFRTAARAYAVSALGRLADPGLADYRLLVKAADALPLPEAAARVEALAAGFEKMHPGSAHARSASYFRGKALRALDRAADALVAFERVLGPGEGGACGFEDEAHFQLGEMEEEAGRWVQASACFARVANEYPGSRVLGPALYRWGLALHKARRFAAAREVLEHALASFPEDPLSRDARIAIRR